MYRFGDFRLDPATRELHRGGERLVLPPKTFDCLLWLIEHRDRAVGRDELIAAVWGRTDVADNLLVQVITRLRRMIDAAGSDSAIRTIPRFGYRWVVATEVLDAAAADAVVSPAAAAKPVAGPQRRGLLALAAGATLAAVALALLLALRAPSAPATRASLALVLPVAVEAEPQHGWMRLGLMVALIDRLRAAGQPVVPAANVAALAPEAGAVSGGALQAPLVIAARAQPDGDRWRVSLQTLRGREPPLEATAESPDALDAARLASDRLARQLGLEPAAAPDRIEDAAGAARSLTQRLIRAEAATLAGDIDTARSLLDAADAAERQSPDWRYQRAWVDFSAGRLDDAQARLERLLAELTADDAATMRARAYNGLANVQYERGDLDGLRRSADAAIALLHDRDAPGEFGRALMSRGVAHAQSRDADAAQHDFLQARVALESAGDRLGVARAELALGIVAKRRGRLVEALPALEGAAAHLGAFDAAHDELVARSHLAEAQLLLLEPAAALAGEPRLRELSAREHAPRARALADLLRIETLSANGRLREAGELLAQACGRDDCGVRLGLTRSRHRLQPQAAQAIEGEMQAQLSQLPPGETGRDAGRSWLTVLRGALARGDQDGARATALAMQAWAARGEDEGTRLYTDLAEAEQHAAADRVELARRAFDSAQRRAAAGQVPDDMLWVAQAYAGWLIRSGDLAGASAVAGGVAGWARRDYDTALLQLRLQHALGAQAPWQAALERARLLAGERRIPADLERAPPARDADPRTRIAASGAMSPSP